MSTAKKYKATQAKKDEQVRVLKAALFTEGSTDKDVTAGIAPAFMKVKLSPASLAPCLSLSVSVCCTSLSLSPLHNCVRPFSLQYDRNGCDFVIDFSAKLSEAESTWAFDLVKTNMESVYDASGYGWDDGDKQRELTEPGGRFLLVREKTQETAQTTPGKLVGFCHFRFTVQGDGECTCNIAAVLCYVVLYCTGRIATRV